MPGCPPPPPPARGRYAPSPTGRLHLGNARTALLAWLWARAQGGAFVLRVEDLDPGRSRRAFEAEQLADLRWLGLDWDEGPDVGGPHGPYRQSERADLYAAALARLDTFPCTCTRREVREASLAPHGAEPVYPGTCLTHPPRPDRPAAIRWRPPPGTVTAHDALQGALTQDLPRDVGAPVLRRRDGAFAYQLAVVVDDAAMGIEQVVRGRDLWPSTPRQVALQRALDLPTPRYAHVPLLLTADGRTKLSKRDGAPSLTELREGGANPRAVVATLARTCGLLPDGVAELAPRELLTSFTPRRVPTADTRLTEPLTFA